ncbi:MAG TPA: hypothetical protein VKR56_09345 [Candidatus Cybelea sp.]|nr:hypothetical protein [Candidatus Cybelea sp.]
MSQHHLVKGLAGLGTTVLALLIAGCGGAGSQLGSAPAGQGLMPSSTGVSDAMTFDRHHRHRACAATANTWKFNNTAISKGSWLYFASIFTVPGPKQAEKITMTDSKITFVVGNKTVRLKGPDMVATVDSSGTVHLKFKGRKFGRFFGDNGEFKLVAPEGTAGNDFLNAVAWRVTRDIPGNMQNVTWSGKFYSKTGTKFMWKWGAAVYTRLSKDYKRLDVKALDDQKYPPYNNDSAGTPERYKNFVTAGGTGNGHNQYIGAPSPPTNVTPCA